MKIYKSVIGRSYMLLKEYRASGLYTDKAGRQYDLRKVWI